MKATGIVRRIDDLGRVVIPKEIRRTMRIREGDPLEIYTEKDGEVIFKKYSPMGEWSDSAAQICESLYKTAGCFTAVTDRDSYIAVCGTPRRELIEKHISSDLEQLMEARKIYLRKDNDQKLTMSDESDKFIVEVAAPIISEGDVMGCVVMFSEGDRTLGELEYKLSQTVAGFLGRQMES